MSARRSHIEPSRPCFEALEPRLFLDAQVVGEVGQVAVTHLAVQVDLSQSYTNPVVFATRQHSVGPHQTIARVFNVKSNRFNVRLVEAPNLDGIHMSETVSYLVVEAGTWNLADGTRIEVGRKATGATVTSSTPPRWARIRFLQSFSTAPTIITQVQTAVNWTADYKYVDVRQHSKGTSDFLMTMQHADSITDGHGVETIGYLAVEPGSGTWSGHTFDAIATGRGTTSGWGEVSLGSSFTETPNVFGGLGSKYGGDGAHLRIRSIDADSFLGQSREDSSVDAELDHLAETVDVLAIQGTGPLSVDITAAETPVAQSNRTVYTGSQYTVRMVDVSTFNDLTRFTLRVMNTTGLAGYDAGTFDGVYFGYTGITGQLHQHYSTGPATTSATADSVYATAIDTHFLANIGDMLTVETPTESVDAWASAVASDATPPFDGFATTDFGRALTGVFAVDAQQTWDVAQVVAATGTRLKLNFFVSGTTGGEVISKTFTV